jgi:hypothetical protein
MIIVMSAFHGMFLLKMCIKEQGEDIQQGRSSIDCLTLVYDYVKYGNSLFTVIGSTNIFRGMYKYSEE